MKLKTFFLLCIFVLSRITFINSFPVFFDSPEYLERFAYSNYFQAIASGHIPFHAGYIILFWPVFHIAEFLNINPSFAVIFAQIIFSAISLYCFYRLVEILTSKKIAIIATIISSLMPLYWITNVSIMAESTYVYFFLISLYLTASYVKNKTRSNFRILIGCLLFGLALLTNPLVILWTPLFLSIVYFLNKQKIAVIILSMFLTITLVILTNGLFVSYALHESIQNGIYQYLFREDIKLIPNVSSSITILRFIRNVLISVLQNNASLIFILGTISLIRIFRKNINLFIITFLWIFPLIITSQWFDPLLFGRHGIIAGFGFSLLVAILLKKRGMLILMVIGYLLFVSMSALSLLTQPIPYLEMGKFVKTLPKGLLIESHFARPQVEGQYSDEIIFINQPGWNHEKLEKMIDTYLQNKKPIFITSQALSDPYGIYSGPFLFPLSLSYAKNYELKDLISSYSIKKYAVIDEDAGIQIYKILSKEKSLYPEIPILKYNRHRIDYFDPLSQLFFYPTPFKN